MRASGSPRLKDHDRNTFRRLLVTMLAMLVLAMAMISLLVFPLLLGHMFAARGDLSRISDIGQAYGAASAMISAVALGVVVLGQYRQARRARLQMLSDMTDELVQLAMDEPRYRQCWGARMAPDDVDEALFYYCNRVLRSWKVAWELHDLSEAQARAYLASFFQSEIPRRFWQRHGDLQMQAKLTSWRARFVVLVNEEYLRAMNAGPPARTHEHGPPSRRAPRTPRRHLVEADNINERPSVP